MDPVALSRESRVDAINTRRVPAGNVASFRVFRVVRFRVCTAQSDVCSGFDSRPLPLNGACRLIRLMNIQHFFVDIRDYPRSVIPDALCCWVRISRQRSTTREPPLGASRDGTFRTGCPLTSPIGYVAKGMDSGVLKK